MSQYKFVEFNEALRYGHYFIEIAKDLIAVVCCFSLVDRICSVQSKC
uniref:Uncharacterized protein n=1 Tax=Arundo donax TaxID=35708 RepID=A0A0A9BQF5_ARUDO